MIVGSWSYALLSTVLGLFYPAWCSFKAIRTSKKEDDVQWLTYWVVYAVFGLLEYVMDYIISWMPLYYELKLGFLFWLQSPTFEGATVLYIKYLEPWLVENESKIEETISQGKATLATLRSEDLARYGAMAYKAVMGAAEKVQGKATEVAKETVKEAVKETVTSKTEETAETDKDK